MNRLASAALALALPFLGALSTGGCSEEETVITDAGPTSDAATCKQLYTACVNGACSCTSPSPNAGKACCGINSPASCTDTPCFDLCCVER